MQPHDLLNSAKVLLAHGAGKPSQINLRRAISAIYYALFHCLARSSANLLIGGGAASKSPAWLQTYRALEHGVAHNACKNGGIVKEFPKAIEDFANCFITMQDKRHQADYDPIAKFSKSEVQADLASAEQVIKGFQAEPVKHRRAFCAYVIFRPRKK